MRSLVVALNLLMPASIDDRMDVAADCKPVNAPVNDPEWLADAPFARLDLSFDSVLTGVFSLKLPRNMLPKEEARLLLLLSAFLNASQL